MNLESQKCNSSFHLLCFESFKTIFYNVVFPPEVISKIMLSLPDYASKKYWHDWQKAT